VKKGASPRAKSQAFKPTPQISCYRYGSERAGEGLRIGAARHVPRGIKREDWQRKNYFDIWVPLLAPSSDLVANYVHKKIPFAVFARRYRTEMKNRESRQVIQLIAAASFFQPLSVGCFCENEALCHRRLLLDLILKEAKARAGGFSKLEESEGETFLKFASPVCFGHEDA